MIVAPHIFRQIEWQSRPADASLGRKPPLEVSPEALKAVYVVAVAVGVLAFAVVYESVDVAFCRNAGIALPGVGVDGGTALYPTVNEGQKRLCFDIRHDLGPYLAPAAEDAEDRGLAGAPAALAAERPLGLALVLPLAAYIGLIDLDGAAEDLRYVLGHGIACAFQGAQDAGALKAGLIGDGAGAQAAQKPPQNLDPFRPLQPKRGPTGVPFVFAGATPVPSPTDRIDFFERTPGTSFA